MEKNGAILNAARKLFSERGVDGTTTREIAALAETTERTLFKHFGSKAGLLHALIERSTLEMFQQPAYARVWDPQPFTSAEFFQWHRDFLRDRVQSSLAEPETYRVLFREMFRDDGFRQHYGSKWLEGVFVPLANHLRAMQSSGDIASRQSPQALAAAFYSLNLSYLVARFVLMPDFPWNDDQNIRSVVDSFAAVCSDDRPPRG